MRKNGTCPWLRPDGKTQVTVEYKRDGGVMIPIRVHTILISTQHNEDVTNEKIREDIMEHVIKPVVPAKYLDDKTIYHINPSGRFVIGGPHGDAGLTGRKIIIDTYGGWGAHGGGAFSGKDPTKVDRSGAYIARQAAKSIVAAGLAKRALVQISYAIGVAKPLSVFVDTYGTGTKPDHEILAAVEKVFDFRWAPAMPDCPPPCRVACFPLLQDELHGQSSLACVVPPAGPVSWPVTSTSAAPATRRRRPTATSAAMTPTSHGRRCAPSPSEGPCLVDRCAGGSGHVSRPSAGCFGARGRGSRGSGNSGGSLACA